MGDISEYALYMNWGPSILLSVVLIGCTVALIVHRESLEQRQAQHEYIMQLYDDEVAGHMTPETPFISRHRRADYLKKWAGGISFDTSNPLGSP